MMKIYKSYKIYFLFLFLVFYMNAAVSDSTQIIRPTVIPQIRKATTTSQVLTPTSPQFSGQCTKEKFMVYYDSRQRDKPIRHYDTPTRWTDGLACPPGYVATQITPDPWASEFAVAGEFATRESNWFVKGLLGYLQLTVSYWCCPTKTTTKTITEWVPSSTCPNGRCSETITTDPSSPMP